MQGGRHAHLRIINGFYAIAKQWNDNDATFKHRVQSQHVPFRVLQIHLAASTDDDDAKKLG